MSAIVTISRPRRRVRTAGVAADVLPPALRGEFDSNPVTAAMVSRDFCLDSNCLKAYAEAGGTWGGGIAGTAVCAATGVAAPFAPLCAAVGAFIGGLVARGVADALGKLTSRARGRSVEQQELDAFLRTPLLSGETRPQVWRRAPERILAVSTYAAERRALVESLRGSTGATEAQVSAALSAGGAPTVEQGAEVLGWFGSDAEWDLATGLGLTDPVGWVAAERPRLEAAGLLETGPEGYTRVDKPGREHPLFAEWKIAADLYGSPPTITELYQATLMSRFPGGPPSPAGVVSLDRLGQDARTLGVVRTWQRAMRSEVGAAADRARAAGYVDFGQNRFFVSDRALRWFSPAKSGKKSAVPALVAAGLGLGVALALT